MAKNRVLRPIPDPVSDDLREQWSALTSATTLHMLPTQALIASIQDLARELLVRDAALDRVRALCAAAEAGWDEDSTGAPREVLVVVDDLRAALDGPGE